MDEPVSTEELAASWLDVRLFVPLTVGAFLLVGAGLVWAGGGGSHAALLGLFYGGIGSVVVGIFAGLIVGAPSLFSIALGGVVWILVQRGILVTGPAFRWAAIPLAVLGLILLPGAIRRTRAVVRERERWAATKGGSVPP